ncbi:hypothetical protein [Insolitispirillum peregrinum]|uniref:hypothetical protein n=1 Tax=Insolitispirillum peregrinum TaxID=80876 RepID=UPI00360977DE
MLMNTGLFILIWESVTVSVAATVRAFFPSFALYEMLIQAVVLLPVAVVLTIWVDRRLLQGAPPLIVTHEPHDAPVVDDPCAKRVSSTVSAS